MNLFVFRRSLFLYRDRTCIYSNFWLGFGWIAHIFTRHRSICRLSWIEFWSTRASSWNRRTDFLFQLILHLFRHRTAHHWCAYTIHRNILIKQETQRKILMFILWKRIFFSFHSEFWLNFRIFWGWEFYAFFLHSSYAWTGSRNLRTNSLYSIFWVDGFCIRIWKELFRLIQNLSVKNGYWRFLKWAFWSWFL